MLRLVLCIALVGIALGAEEYYRGRGYQQRYQQPSYNRNQGYYKTERAPYARQQNHVYQPKYEEPKREQQRYQPPQARYQPKHEEEPEEEVRIPKAGDACTASGQKIPNGEDECSYILCQERQDDKGSVYLDRTTQECAEGTGIDVARFDIKTGPCNQHNLKCRPAPVVRKEKHKRDPIYVVIL